MESAGLWATLPTACRANGRGAAGKVAPDRLYRLTQVRKIGFRRRTSPHPRSLPPSARTDAPAVPGAERPTVHRNQSAKIGALTPANDLIRNACTDYASKHVRTPVPRENPIVEMGHCTLRAAGRGEPGDALDAVRHLVRTRRRTVARSCCGLMAGGCRRSR